MWRQYTGRSCARARSRSAGDPRLLECGQRPEGEASAVPGNLVKPPRCQDDAARHGGQQKAGPDGPAPPREGAARESAPGPLANRGAFSWGAPSAPRGTNVGTEAAHLRVGHGGSPGQGVRPDLGWRARRDLRRRPDGARRVRDRRDHGPRAGDAARSRRTTYVDIPAIARETIRDIGYTVANYGFDAETCGVIVSDERAVARISHGRRPRVRGEARRAERCSSTPAPATRA